MWRFHHFEEMDNIYSLLHEHVSFVSHIKIKNIAKIIEKKQSRYFIQAIYTSLINGLLFQRTK